MNVKSAGVYSGGSNKIKLIYALYRKATAHPKSKISGQMNGDEKSYSHTEPNMGGAS